MQFQNIVHKEDFEKYIQESKDNVVFIHYLNGLFEIVKYIFFKQFIIYLIVLKI
jgi:hypothetical protein